jgi:diguanylate cyclase (GGDEF)-like protein
MKFWKRSIYAATAAKVLCQKTRIVQHEEVFLATLMADIGMLVLDQVTGEAYGAIYERATDHNHLPAAEREALGLTHAEVGGIMAEIWKLPALLATPITNHHNPEGIEDPALRKLAEVVQLAGRCADVFVDDVASDAIRDVRAACKARNNMPEAECDALLADIGAKTREIASLFEINIGTAIDYEKILKKANEALVEITLQTQQQANVMAEQNLKLKEAVTTDALTGLGNRQKFDSSLAECFEAAVASAGTVSLIMIDLDHFKKVNDVHGHPAGDAVLRHVAKMLRTTARAQDIACRYGGEEMALILPGTSRSTAAATAETIRRVICAKPVPIPDGSLEVSGSIGVATYEPGGTLMTTAHLVKAADMALYNAKHSGRNCVKVFTMKPAAAA